MSKASELRKQRREKKNLARRRAETHSSGFESTSLKIPDGLNFFNPDEGIYVGDIVPYIVGKGNPMADPGEEYYERTYWRYKDIGAAQKKYVCPSKTFNKPDPIAEWRQKHARDESKEEEVSALKPQERQLFLWWDHKDREKGVQLWEVSYHLFGKLLDERIRQRGEEDWDQFWYPDCGGYTLRLTFSQDSIGKNSFVRVSAIDFKPRDDDYEMPKEIREHGICLDDLLVEVPYDKLKAIFLMLPEEEVSGNGEASDQRPKDEEKVPFDDEPREKPKEKEKPKLPKASDFDISVGDQVRYQGSIMDVAKISGDETSLLLIDPKTDDIYKGVGPEEVEKVGEEKETASVSASSEPDDFGDEDWDKDWT